MNTPHRMPVLFVGHGSPMNALQENEFARGWKAVAREVPRPAAILCVSAHWETAGSLVTSTDPPPTLHDFDGFPLDLYQVRYPAPGSPWLVRKVTEAARKFAIGLDREWGLDHGCWCVLRWMYPHADIPVVQLSLDRAMPTRLHYELGRALDPLRDEGVLIIASGNLVHNLGRISLPPRGDFATPFALPWASEAAERIKGLIDSGSSEELIAYRSLGSAVQLAVPTPEHYLPLLYVLGMRTH
ncbi:MAG TPA: 4,5-DOPA dioxygenase extradiol, partial [Spirochaetia bacterium]|nr:4,5-DOPA dioxygenase extradiol [Spirochaetia bacterium]